MGWSWAARCDDDDDAEADADGDAAVGLKTRFCAFDHAGEFVWHVLVRR